MAEFRKYSEAWYLKAIEKLEAIKEKLGHELDMFERYKIYGDEMELLRDIDEYEKAKAGHIYESFEERV